MSLLDQILMILINLAHVGDGCVCVFIVKEPFSFCVDWVENLTVLLLFNKIIHLFKNLLLFELSIEASFEIFLDDSAVVCIFFWANLIYLRITHVTSNIRHGLVSDLGHLLLDHLVLNLFHDFLVCLQFSELSGILFAVDSVIKSMIVASILSGNSSLLNSILFHLLNEPFESFHLGSL